MLWGYRNRGAWASAYFLFQAELGLLREKGRLVTLWSNLPFVLWQTHLYPPKNEYYPPVLSTEKHMHAHMDTHVTMDARAGIQATTASNC